MEEPHKTYQKELQWYKVRRFYYIIVRKFYHLFNNPIIIGKYLIKIGKRIITQQEKIMYMQKEILKEMP